MQSNQLPPAAEKDDIEAESASEHSGRTVGGITYYNVSDDFIRRVEERIAKGIPLQHEDDDSLESNLLFRFLSAEQQAQVSAVTDPLEKRKMIVTFLDQIERSGGDIRLTY